MDILAKIYNKKNNLVSRKIGDEYILVPIINNIAEMDKVYTLNEVGAFIWDNIDGKNNIRQIIHSVTSEFDVDEVTATADVTEFIKMMENIIIN
ncbi:MAG: PqqD family protein [Bacteroidia bacterium]|nr:PqqD family protein [Bacteroidia bacterium]